MGGGTQRKAVRNTRQKGEGSPDIRLGEQTCLRQKKKGKGMNFIIKSSIG